MRLDEVVAKIKGKFPSAIEVSNPEKINQNGLYLYFDGITPIDTATDAAHFVLLLAGNTLSAKGSVGIIEELMRIRGSVFALGIEFRKNCFRGVKAAVFEGSTLFMYAVKLEIEVKI